MSDLTRAGQTLDAIQSAQAPRRGKPWTEEDFLAVMRGCRSGAGLEEIASAAGRTPDGLRVQLRRLLPHDERHLPVDLALARLRQLDRDGDYDWLGALAQRTKSMWELQREAQAEQDIRGIGALSDEDLLTTAPSMAMCVSAAPSAAHQRFGNEVRRRGLGAQLGAAAAAAASAGVRGVIGPDPSYWDYDMAY